MKLVDEGVIERIKYGVYFYEEASQDSMMIDVEKIIPGGVLCLYSAWAYYELTVQIPQSFNIAIEKNRKISLPDYPPITLYYWQHDYYEMGIVSQTISGYKVHMYDLEKSVCDAIKYRTKIGMETTSEILKTYLNRKDRNLTRLIDYAKKMRVANILKTYMEIQL
ncbi:hypothetical protein D0T85_02335 [Bacteroides sp. 519]|nr:hypothetical protein [Bacteroides sp. 519]